MSTAPDPPPHRNGRDWRALAGNLALLLATVLVTLAVMEGGYRLFAVRHGTLQTFNAVSKPLYEYSSETGYGYIPGTRAVTAYVQKGKLLTCDVVSVGPFGNLGDGARSWTDQDFKILAFGASFTTNPYKYQSWTDHIAEPMEPSVGRHVEVMNLGRDSFGLLSMVRLASRTLRNTPADLAVVAFIADDIDRARTWRTTLRIDGMERVLMSLKPHPGGGSPEELRPRADIVQVNDRITEDWCRSALAVGNPDDPTLVSLREQRRQLIADDFTAGFTTLRTSFLLDRLLHGDPFFSVRPMASIPRVEYPDFHGDEAFVQDLQELMQQKVPVLFVLLPGYLDLKAGALQLTPQRRMLLDSLEKLTGGKVVSAMDYLENPVQDPESMFFVPEDEHPREKGERRYAEAIVKAIRARLPSPH